MINERNSKTKGAEYVRSKNVYDDVNIKCDFSYYCFDSVSNYAYNKGMLQLPRTSLGEAILETHGAGGHFRWHDQVRKSHVGSQVKRANINTTKWMLPPQNKDHNKQVAIMMFM